MMKKILISILLLALTANAYSGTIFTDDFADGTNSVKLSYWDNVNINTNSVVVTTASNTSGSIKSILIAKNSTNIQWNQLTVRYSSVIFPAKITMNILDSSSNLLKSIILKQSGNQKYKFNLYDDDVILTNESFFLQAILKNASGNKPKLKLWSVTTNLIKDSGTAPSFPGRFYGAPSPLRIEDDASKMDFYYEFTKSGKATLKIYDTNYALIDDILDSIQYSAGDYINTSWDGKNGNGISCMSGVYIGKLTVEFDDGTAKEEDPFLFAIIR